MRKFGGSPKFDNLNDKQFEAFMIWWKNHFEYTTTKPFSSNPEDGQWSLKGVNLTIHEIVEYWYYEILKPE